MFALHASAGRWNGGGAAQGRVGNDGSAVRSRWGAAPIQPSTAVGARQDALVDVGVAHVGACSDREKLEQSLLETAEGLDGDTERELGDAWADADTSIGAVAPGLECNAEDREMVYLGELVERVGMLRLATQGECTSHGWVRKVRPEDVDDDSRYDRCMDCDWQEFCSAKELNLYKKRANLLAQVACRRLNVETAS